ADRDFLTAEGEDPAAALFIVDAAEHVAGFEVALIAADNPVAQILAAVLDARVTADDLVLELQHEVIDRSIAPDEERVPLGGILLRSAAGDRAVFDAPELRVAVPTFEILAVEDRLEAVFGKRQPRGADRHERDQRHQKEPVEARHGVE